LLLSSLWNKKISSSDPKIEEEDIFESDEDLNEEKKSVKVFDRFTMILQIFAKRAKTRVAKLQVFLA